jgi:hypothetical protein
VCCTFIAKDNFISPTIHRLIAWGLVLMALGVEPHAFAIDDSGHETFRLVRMRVLNADGSAAVHRDVYLQGWDRRAIGPLLGQAFDSFITSNDRLKRENPVGSIPPTIKAKSQFASEISLDGRIKPIGRVGELTVC